jgi:hypothetical protein
VVLLGLLAATVAPASALDHQAAPVTDPTTPVADPTTWTAVGDDVVVGVRGPATERVKREMAVARAASGYTLIDPGMGIRSSYTLRMVESGNYAAMTDELQAAAAALERATGANFVVGSSTSNEVPATGQITVKLSSSSPCGPLGDFGTVGCGGPDGLYFGNETEWKAGRVWLFPNAPTASYGYLTLIHELGHAIGLDHFDPTFQGRHMAMNCCSLNENEGSIDRYLNGDVMGLRRLAQVGYLDGGVAPKRTPGAVDRPSASPALDGVTARWLVPPMFGAAVDQYQVQARNTATQGTKTVTGGSATARTVGGLTGGATYEVRVRAHNALGWGSWSSWSSPVTATRRCLPSISDVPETSGFCDEISWLVDSGISGGFADGTFRPGTAVSRQAMASFLRSYAEMLDPGSTDGPFPDPDFPDVPDSSLFAEDIAWLADSEITGGYGDGTFRPTAPVSRLAMAAFLHAFVEHLDPGATGCPPPTVSCTGEPFDDVTNSNLFRGEISWLYDAGISEGSFEGGDWVFKPTASTNRDAMAAFLSRLDDWLAWQS